MPETKISQDVRQDHRGRNYRVEYYVASGRVRQFIYVDDATKLEPGYVVPKPPEAVRKVPIVRKIDEQAQKRRLAVVQFRRRNEREVEELKYDDARNAQALVDHLRPLVRWTGKDWIALFPAEADHYVQYHEEI